MTQLDIAEQAQRWVSAKEKLQAVQLSETS
jgi:hypothetical protein